MNAYKILIPRAYARMESDVPVRTVEEAEKIECYELYLFDQIGTFASRRPLYVYLRLPKQDLMVPISLLPYYSGLEFEKSTRKHVLREYDELDRRIILGFCDNYSHAMRVVSNKTSESTPSRTMTKWSQDELEYLRKEALQYRADQHAKRIKQGVTKPLPAHLHNFVRQNMQPYDESAGIFSSVVFI